MLTEAMIRRIRRVPPEGDWYPSVEVVYAEVFGTPTWIVRAVPSKGEKFELARGRRRLPTIWRAFRLSHDEHSALAERERAFKDRLLRRRGELKIDLNALTREAAEKIVERSLQEVRRAVMG